MNDPINKFIGIPWGQVNCWSLVQKIYFEMLGIHLPSYSGVDPNDAKLVADMIEKGDSDFVEVDLAQFGDVLTFLHKETRPSHVGMALNRHQMIHIKEGQLSQRDWFDGSFRGRIWKPRLHGIYRHLSMVKT